MNCGSCACATPKKFASGVEMGFYQCKHAETGRWFAGRSECQFQPVRWVKR